MARSGLGAPARPQFPPLGAGGGACVLPSPPAGLPGAAHPARDGGGREAFLEKLRAHLSGTGPARPDTTPPPPGGIRRAARAFPAPPTGRKEARAGGALEAGSPHSPRGPAASGPGARHSDAGKQNSFPGWGAQRPEPGGAHTTTTPRTHSRLLRRAPVAHGARAAAPRTTGRDATAGTRFDSGTAPPVRRPPSQPLPRDVRTNLGGQPGQLCRRAGAYAEEGGGGITCGGRRLHRDAPGRRRRAAPWTLRSLARPRLPPGSAAEEPGHHGRRQRRRREQQHMTL